MAKTKQSDIAFLMMKEWREQLALLTDEQKGKLLTAIYDYQCDGVEFDTDDSVLKMLWVSMKQVFEINNRKYEEVCQLNREKANKRWKKNDAAAYSGINKNAENADIDIEKDIDTDIDKDIVIDIEGETVADKEADKDVLTAAYAEYERLLKKRYDEDKSDMHEYDRIFNMTYGEIYAVYDLIGEDDADIYFGKSSHYDTKDRARMIIRWAVEDGVL